MSKKKKIISVITSTILALIITIANIIVNNETEKKSEIIEINILGEIANEALSTRD